MSSNALDRKEQRSALDRIEEPAAPALDAGLASAGQAADLRGALGTGPVQMLVDPEAAQDAAAGQAGELREIAAGAGQRLPGAVQAKMEASFGADFSGVRVHEGNQATAMGAIAMAQGEDIHFAPGQYQPGSERGQALLGHELAHVVQQRAGRVGTTTQAKGVGINDSDVLEAEADMAGVLAAHGEKVDIAGASASAGGDSAQQGEAPVQRAVGFEFETNLVVAKSKGLTKKPLSKMELIKSYGEGFKMEADENSAVGSTIEFVVDPPIQENDRGKLVSIMDKMTTVAGELVSDKNGTKPSQKLHHLTDVPRKDVFVQPIRYVTANPQITGGIDLGKVQTMLSQVGDGNRNVKEQHRSGAGALERISPSVPQQMASAGAKVNGSPQLQGLVSLLAGYLTNGNEGQPLNYAKLISGGFLVRTDFGSIFNMLPEADKKAFLDPDKNSSGTRGASFVDVVLDAAGFGGTAGEKVFKRGIKAENKPNAPVLDIPALNITRGEWLSAIAHGWDPLSSAFNPALKGELEGLGALGGKADKVGGEVGKEDGKRTGVVMEFRRMAQDADHKRWTDLALKTFDYIVALNNGAEV